MADFPSLTPSTRAFTPAAFPVSTFRAYSGSETRVRRGAMAAGYGLSLSFSALTPAEAKSIRDHYITQQGSFASFDLPAVIWSGITGYADLVETGYRWVYASSPEIADVNCGYQSASVSLRGVYDVAATGFTPGPYDGPLTPTDPADWWGDPDNVNCDTLPDEEADPYYGDVRLLLHMDGANGSTTFVDNSGYQHPISAVGDAAISDSNPKFGTGALSLDDTGDYLTAPGSSAFSLGTGDFTIELWIFRPSETGQDTLINYRWPYSGGYAVEVLGQLSGLKRLAFRAGSGSGILVSWPGLTINTWQHIAVVRSSGVISLYGDGMRLASVTNDSSFSYESVILPLLYVGTGFDTSLNRQDFAGRIDEVRITANVARYAGDSFTVPDRSFPNE